MTLLPQQSELFPKMFQEKSPPESLVALAKSLRTDYGMLEEPVPAPELRERKAATVALAALRELFRIWGLDGSNFGSSHWNPLGSLISAGSKVVLKPNWVLHANKSGYGMDCLVTHTTVIEAVLEYVALARPGIVVLGDSPVQGCDFEALRTGCAVDQMASRFRERGMNLSICDFRRTLLPGGNLGRAKIEGVRGLEHFILFDLNRESLLEPLAQDARKFRVTMYDPDLMFKTHCPGRHQYLIAREIIEADTILNLPKLKSHKKACLTGALKNMVGINGHKEYLPHHRKGGSLSGGDCYEGASFFKSVAESLLDAANRSKPGAKQTLLAKSAGAMRRLAVSAGQDDNLEGSWHGNDTVWRTCIDLQRIALYGQLDGTLATTPQRRIVSITDAIIAGEGEGPMRPTPVPSGYLTGAINTAAAEWAHARLMGFDPRRIPLLRGAFTDFSYPLVDFLPSEIHLRSNEAEIPEGEIFPINGRAFSPSAGWKGYCELDATHNHKSR
jgi:uncharacterized protein (DUF362 family)